MEKRSLTRKHMQVPVSCSSIMTNSPPDDFCGTMLNYSWKGICIRLNHRIRKGSIVMIKADSVIVEENSEDLLEGFRSLSVAEVMWLKSLDDQAGCSYAIGLRYLSF